MRIVIIGLLLFMGIFVNAQEFIEEKPEVDVFESLKKDYDVYGKVNIYQDTCIRNLVYKDVLINRENKGYEGYRVRIFSAVGSGARQNAEKVKSEFLQKHPDCEVVMDYNNPNFRVLIGDFRSKSEALKLMNKVKSEYPEAFIVKDIIPFED